MFPLFGTAPKGDQMIYVTCLLSGGVRWGMVAQISFKRPSRKDRSFLLDPHVLFLQLLEKWYSSSDYLFVIGWLWRAMCQSQLTLKWDPVSAGTRKTSFFKRCSSRLLHVPRVSPNMNWSYLQSVMSIVDYNARQRSLYLHSIVIIEQFQRIGLVLQSTSSCLLLPYRLNQSMYWEIQ